MRFNQLVEWGLRMELGDKVYIQFPSLHTFIVVALLNDVVVAVCYFVVSIVFVPFFGGAQVDNVVLAR